MTTVRLETGKFGTARTRNRTALALFLLVALFMSGRPAQAQAPVVAERLALAAYRQGQWDIYSIAPDGSAPRQLTRNTFEDTDPVYAPDGSKIAYASRRDGNWDVYVLDLQTGKETRLTDSPHYDGAPTWSPDGEMVAYESYQNENLDIWVVEASGRQAATNLTVDSPEGDFAPAWNPNGQTIAFASWRLDEPDQPVSSGQKTNSDLYLMEVATGNVTRLTADPAAEIWPIWQPDGDKLAFVVDDVGDREVFTLDVAAPPAAGGVAEPVTWLGRTDGPAWSPDGQTIAAVFHRWDGEIVTTTQLGAAHQLAQQLTGIIAVQGRLSWHAQALDFGASVPSLAETGVSHLYQERISSADEAATSKLYSLVRFNDIEVGTPWLADTVDDSFKAWRFRLRNEVGYDFLSQLSDAARDIGAYTETSQYASWHKSGRAIDTLFDYYLDEQLAHEIAREDYSGETYWRIFLRCVDQSGRCGRPLVVNPWNYSERARLFIAPEQGGIEKAHLAGYYVDMTAIAREYGWERISSYDDEDYSWTWHFLAFEYWHYQKRLEKDGVVNWYQAMLDIYPPRTLQRFFNWERMRRVGDDPHLVALKGVPLPLEVKPWWALVEQ